VTVDEQRPGFVGGQRRQTSRHRTLHCHAQERFWLSWRHR